MPWFKVDDSFVGNPKRAACSPAALGLWVVAGSWCAQQLTDGFVPEHMLPMLAGTARTAAELVRVGLWEAADGGWRFHDWFEYQPTREHVESERNAARERQRRAREKAKSQRESRRDESVSHTAVTAGVTVPPTRPDPTRPEVPNGTSLEARKRATRIPDNWQPSEQDIAWQREQGISDLVARRELDTFRDYWRAKARDNTKLDWSATWRNWLRRAGQYGPSRPPARDELDPMGWAR